MKNKVMCAVMAVVMTLASQGPVSFAAGRESAASLLLPTTGQAMNGEIGSTKTKVMAGLEVAAITTIVILGTAVGGGIVWAGLGPLLANHLWSATDAHQNAGKGRQGPAYESGMVEAQRTLEYSRQRRFEREEEFRGGLRDRVRQAAELGYNA